MKNAQIFKLVDLIEDVKKIESIIQLHAEGSDSTLMKGQYEAKKAKLMSQIIDELIAPSVQSPQTIALIQQILSKFYPKTEIVQKYDGGIEKLAAAIEV